MKKTADPKKEIDPKTLRHKAEKALKDQSARIEELSRQDVKKLVTELGTHQIELEMQNEELRRVLSELDESRGKYADLYDFAPIGYFTLDDRGLIREVNQTGADLLGTTKRLLLNKSFSLFLPDENDKRVFWTHCKEVFLDPTRHSCKVRLEGIKRSSFAALLQSIAVQNDDGKPGFIRTSVTDISELKETEEALRTSEERYRMLVAGVQDYAIFMLDTQGRVFSWNEGAMRITGYSSEVVIGKHFSCFFTPEDLRIGKPAKELKAAEGNGRYEDEGWQLHKDGSPFWANVVITALRDRKGRPLGFSIITRDLTERKNAEDTLRSANAALKRRTSELEAVNHELEAFAYTVSHDLKAPLRGIEGFTRALLEDYADRLDEGGRDYLKRVTSASQRMTQLIDAMMSMARLTSGELREKTVDLSSLAQVIARELKKKEPERQVEFLIAEKLSVNGDEDMLGIMLQNLIENSWKFTSKHTTAKIEFGTTEMDGKRVYFVRDDGAGFDMTYADILFMPFKRMHSDSEFPGVGIGLAIAQRIVMRHNGRLWAEAAPEKGATFYFTL